MTIKRMVGPKQLVGQEGREERLTLRLRASDATALKKLAEEHGVGPSTLARLIIERYVADHGGRR